MKNENKTTIEIRTTSVLGMTCDCAEVSGDLLSHPFRDVVAFVHEEDRCTLIHVTSCGISCETFRGSEMNGEFTEEDAQSLVDWFGQQYALDESELNKVRRYVKDGSMTVRSKREREARAIADRMTYEEISNVRVGILSFVQMLEAEGSDDFAAEEKEREKLYARAETIKRERP